MSDRSPEKKELDRNAILICLGECNPKPATISYINRRIALEGVRIPEETIEQDIAYLKDKDMVIQQHAELSIAKKHYRITSKGQEYLEQMGLE